VASEASRWPATVGVLAMVAGAVLMAVSGRSEPPRPRVLGEMLVSTTTSVAPGLVHAETSSPSTSRRPATLRHATTTTATSMSVPGASTSTTAASSSSSSTPPPTSTSTTVACPSGAPVADVRTWDDSAEVGGAWHVTITGVVTNRTGAAVHVGAVAVTIERADGDTYAVPADARPAPDPPTVADGGESAWRWEGDVPAGSAPSGPHAGVTEWSWVAAPPGCGD
jgi:hypothetical protein